MEGQTVPHLRLFEQLGGATGIAYSAEYKCLDKTLRLKCLPSEITPTMNAEERF
jgi:hypothetical protein